MDITVSGRHTEISDTLRRVTEEKLSRLERFVDMDHAEVHFAKQKNPRIPESDICEVTLVGHGHHVRAKVAAADAFAAIDRATEKLEQQLSRLKSKLLDRYHGGIRGSRSATVAATSAGHINALGPSDDRTAGEQSSPVPRIVKKKRFAIIPMSAEEASQRMALLGHSFFFFTNSATGRAAVVYARDDGDIGLIDDTR